MTPRRLTRCRTGLAFGVRAKDQFESAPVSPGVRCCKSMHDRQAIPPTPDRPGSFTPQKTVRDYSTQERLRFQEQFKTVAQSYTARLRAVLKLVALTLLLLVPFAVSIAYGVDYGFWLFGAGIVACLIGMAILLLKATILCPACQGNLDTGLGAFCPECGGELRYGRNSREPECLACGVRLRFAAQARGGRARAFKVRSCTYCGIKLDESGV